MQAHGFRVCFTPLLEVLFTFPSRYLCAIGLSVVFSLAGWAPQIPAEFLVLRGTQVPARPDFRFRVRGSHPLRPRFPPRSATINPSLHRRSYNPDRALTRTVWAPARSLATTCAITFVFSSCGYLDVSVPRVRPAHKRGVGIAAHGFPHSDTAGSQRICRSPAFFAACHVLLRLREPQASPVRPCSTFLSFF